MKALGSQFRHGLPHPRTVGGICHPFLSFRGVLKGLHSAMRLSTVSVMSWDLHVDEGFWTGMKWDFEWDENRVIQRDKKWGLHRDFMGNIFVVEVYHYWRPGGVILLKRHGCFHKSWYPIAEWFTMKNPTKMDDDWGYPHFRKPPCVYESYSSMKIANQQDLARQHWPWANETWNTAIEMVSFFHPKAKRLELANFSSKFGYLKLHGCIGIFLHACSKHRYVWGGLLGRYMEARWPI